VISQQVVASFFVYFGTSLAFNSGKPNLAANCGLSVSRLSRNLADRQQQENPLWQNSWSLKTKLGSRWPPV
jgi:hypothetical protein